MGLSSRRLLLIRHAHARDGHAEGDRARELSGRGRDAARALGDWLRARDLLPERLLISPAVRTRQTARLLSEPEPPTIESVDALYLAGPRALAACIASCDPEVQTLGIVAHNPGIWEFAASRAERSGTIVEGYSPATCVVFEFAGAWSDFERLSPRVIAQRQG